MKYLIDTHVFIWSLLEPKKISKKIFDILEDTENEVFISPISFWEMAIKHQANKLDLKGINPLHLPHIAEQYDFTVLNPEPYDYVSIATVPQKENHHDPFVLFQLHYSAHCQSCYNFVLPFLQSWQEACIQPIFPAILLPFAFRLAKLPRK